MSTAIMLASVALGLGIVTGNFGLGLLVSMSIMLTQAFRR